MITLEISSTDIRLMETSGQKVIKWASLSLEPGMFEEGVILDPHALAAVVKQLMTSSDIHGRDVVASVSGLYSLSRIVTVPTPLGESVTQQAVLEAAEEVIPLSEEELYMSWQAIGMGEGGQQVLVVGVPRDVVDSEVRVLRAVGVNPRMLDLKAMALVRAVNREQALILNIEPTSLDMIIVVGGLAEVMHTVAWQQDDLSIPERAEHLATALEMTVDFYNSHHPGFPLDPATPLFITGQMSGDLALVEELQAKMEYPIEPLIPPLEYPAHLPVSQYAVNFGLALKGTAPSKSREQGDYSLPDINLLPQIYRPWRPSARQVQAFCAIILAAILLFPLYQVTSNAMAETADLEARYTIINTELQRRQIEITNREPLQKAVNEYRTIINMGSGFAEDVSVINTEAGRLAVEVKSIDHEGGQIKVTCEADSYTAFRDYVTALEESGRFATPIPPPERFPYTTGGTIVVEPNPSK